MEKLGSNYPQPEGADQGIYKRGQSYRDAERHSPRYRSAKRADHILVTLTEIVTFYQEKENPAIFVFGNLASGKSTFCRKIQSYLREMNWAYFSLDDYRKKSFQLNPGIASWDKEKRAQKMLFTDLREALRQRQMIIIESTYLTNPWAKAVRENKLDLFMIKISTDRNICYQRYVEREDKNNNSPALRLMVTKRANSPFHKTYDHIAFKYHIEKHRYNAHVTFIE